MNLLGATINIDVGDSNLIKLSCCHHSTILLDVFITVLAKNILKHADGMFKIPPTKISSAIPCISHYTTR
jgi:hypothetical protein